MSKLKTTLLLFLCIFSVHAQYAPDVLGDDYLYRTIQMPDDYEGKVVCTLVKKPTIDSLKQAVLYIHGYNDYFFQKELGDSIHAQGYNFYALDLRKYGRSILPNQDPFFCKNLNEYFADIDTALATIRSEGNERILLMAHSTGGLITPYYLNARKGHAKVDGLILNSPFLDWNFGWFMEHLVMPAVSFIGKYFPNLQVQGLGCPNYAYSLLKEEKGEWEFNTEWKKPFGHPKKAGWIHAIHKAQQSIQKQSDIAVPILVLSSDKSLPETNEWSETYRAADIVLDIQDIQTLGKQLGNQVTCDTISNGLHDLLLSAEPYRNRAYQAIAQWLKRN